MCVQHCYGPETNVGTVILITVLPGDVSVCAWVLLIYTGFRQNHFMSLTVEFKQDVS